MVCILQGADTGKKVQLAVVIILLPVLCSILQLSMVPRAE